MTFVAGVYALVWLALEGAVWRDVLLAAVVLALGLIHLATRKFGGRALPLRPAVVMAAAAGFLYGIVLVLMTLFLMSLKTGVHTHGPEYTAQEIAWVWAQLPIWGAAGALVGLGLVFFVAARSNQ